jgi:HAD superfamily hydrolase (TIGR01450 family)
LKNYQHYLIDIDGVIWRGNRLLPGVIDFISWIEKTGRSYHYLSNNSMISPIELGIRIKSFGVPVQGGSVITASSAAVALFARKFPGQPIWVVGLPSLRHMAADAGLHVLNLEQGDAPDDPHHPSTSAVAVLVGLDRQLTYAMLQHATRALLAGAYFLSINRDPQLPVDDGIDPGCGSILAALEASSRRTAEYVGKPSPLLILEALANSHTNPAQAAMIGDTLDMDIAAGRAAGIDTILVLSGISSREDVARTPNTPTWIVRDLADLLDKIHQSSAS